MSKDRVLAITLLLFVIVMFTETFNIAGKNSFQIYSSAFYPRILLAVIAALTVVLLITSFLGNKKGTRKKVEFKDLEKYAKVVLLFVFFGIYISILPYLGFILSSTIYLFISQGILMGYRKVKTLILNVAVSLIATFSIYFIFNNLLNVWLP